jgi:hypothetical protein
MAKGFNVELFFKNNQTVLLIVGLILVAMFVFGVNVDFVGDIFVSKRPPNDNTKRLGGCGAIQEVN